MTEKIDEILRRLTRVEAILDREFPSGKTGDLMWKGRPLSDLSKDELRSAIRLAPSPWIVASLEDELSRRDESP